MKSIIGSEGKQKFNFDFPERTNYTEYNQLGPGYQEKYYQKATEKAFTENNLKFTAQYPIQLKFKNDKIGFYLIDFLVEDKILVEIKKGNYFSKKNIEQVYAYLKATKLKLAVLANFTSTGVKFRRILNLR